MAGKVLTILSIEPSPWGGRNPYHDILVGAQVTLKRSSTLRDGPSHYRFQISRETLTEVNSKCREKGLSAFISQDLQLHCTLGYPDTPELLAYDEIDQEEDPKSTPPLRSSRSRRRTSSGCSGKGRASYNQCSAKPKRLRSRRQRSLNR